MRWGRPPSFFPAARRLLVESVMRSDLNSCSLCQGDRDREEHWPHRCRRFYVSATQIQNAKPRTSSAKLSRQCEHLLRGSAESIPGSDHKSVARGQRAKRPVKLRPRCPGPGDYVTDVGVITPCAGGQQIRLLPIGGLLFQGNPHIADQLCYWSLGASPKYSSCTRASSAGTSRSWPVRLRGSTSTAT